MKKRPPYYKLALYYKIDNILDDISYIECLKVLYNKYNKEDNIIYDINQAFRNISDRGTKKDFRINIL